MNESKKTQNYILISNPDFEGKIYVNLSKIEEGLKAKLLGTDKKNIIGKCSKSFRNNKKRQSVGN